jgi:hypothetical protein
VSEPVLADNLSGWSSLLTRRTCALIDRPGQTSSS